MLVGCRLIMGKNGGKIRDVSDSYLEANVLVNNAHETCAEIYKIASEARKNFSFCFYQLFSFGQTIEQLRNLLQYFPKLNRNRTPDADLGILI